MYYYMGQRQKDARENAENLVKHFKRIIAEYSQAEVWQKGLTTAQEWLRLINADNPSSAEISAFIAVVDANCDRSSAWADMAGGAYQWARTKGVSRPKTLFASEGLLFAAKSDSVTWLEHARMLLKAFERRHEDDPNQ